MKPPPGYALDKNNPLALGLVKDIINRSLDLSRVLPFYLQGLQEVGRLAGIWSPGPGSEEVEEIRRALTRLYTDLMGSLDVIERQRAALAFSAGRKDLVGQEPDFPP